MAQPGHSPGGERCCTSHRTGKNRAEPGGQNRAWGGVSPGLCIPQHHRGSRLWVQGMCRGMLRTQTTQHPSTPSPLPTAGAGSDVPQLPRADPGSTWAELTAACRWRACGSCCWQSRPCGRGWRRRWPGARPWPWRCSAAPAPSRSCTRPWAAPCRGSARSARPPPQAPVLQGNGHSQGVAADPQGAAPSQCPGGILLLREI